jgi:signal transduction histidine kinase
VNGSLQPRTFEVIAQPIEAGPEAEGWVLVIRDVTEEREVRRVVQRQEHLDYDHGNYFVSADLTRMQQVVMNLALNARDAMPEGG